MLTWADHFEGYIISRGKKMAADGAVVGLHHSAQAWQAMVVGTELYTVRVQIARGQVTGFHCSCPYAEDGDLCKHMAAVFFTLESRSPDILRDDDAALALRLDMPAFMLKAVSSIIVVIAISGPYLRTQFPILMKRVKISRGRSAGEGGRG